MCFSISLFFGSVSCSYVSDSICILQAPFYVTVHTSQTLHLMQRMFTFKKEKNMAGFSTALLSCCCVEMKVVSVGKWAGFPLPFTTSRNSESLLDGAWWLLDSLHPPGIGCRGYMRKVLLKTCFGWGGELHMFCKLYLGKRTECSSSPGDADGLRC